MPHIRFTVHADCDSQEPCRIVPALRGEIFEFEGESDNEIRIGQIDAYLVLRGRALNEQESLFEAMDSIDSSVFECYEALFDPETDDWNQSVQDLYKDQIMGLDVLFIESIQLNANYRGKGIGAQVAYAPELMQQPGPASDIASSPAVNRVARGRRRRQFR